MSSNFKDQIEWNMEVYINDMLIKSSKVPDHIFDLEEALNTLCHH